MKSKILHDACYSRIAFMHWKALVLSFFLLLLLPKPTLAVSEFVESYKTVYSIDETGVATVVHNIELKNKISNVYADKYWLSIGFTNLSNVLVNDGLGLVSPEIGHTPNQTTVSFVFRNKVVLKDKVNAFSISYKTPDIVTKNGSVWEINIPKLEVQNDLGMHEITLVVPPSFGKPAFITPEPSSSLGSSYIFRMDLLGNKSISAVFGETQYMNFNLNYFLENINPIKGEIEIALPMDTNYQQIWLRSIDPAPLAVKVDKDGNWLGIYELNGNEKKRVLVNGVAKLSFTPTESPIGSDELIEYIKPSDLWQTDQPKIKDLGTRLVTPKSIYQYVVDYLNYDYGRLTQSTSRVGALGLLEEHRGAICTDYSDLFIALSRAAGIPAREVQGYAFTSNDKLRPVSLSRDVLHSWPEYYDKEKKTWVYVDPTWEDTTGGVDYFNKLDLNHLAFVIHGRETGYPLPAGAYKDPLFASKDVDVNAIDKVAFPEDEVSFEIISNRLTIKNTGGVATSGNLTVSSQPAGIIDYKLNVVKIPPFGSEIIELPVNATINRTQKVTLTINYGEKEYKVETSLKPATIFQGNLAWLALGGIFLGTAAYFASRILLRR